LSYINSGHVRVNVNMGGTSGYSAQVVITNPDGQSASGGFNVVPGTAPPPSISQVTPNQVTLNIPTWLDVYGANINSAFTAGVRVGSTVYPIASAGLSYINSGHVRVNVNMGGTSGYSAQVVITNPDGQSASGGFNVVH